MYPYYTISHLEAGVLKTWKSTGAHFPGSKHFARLEEAQEALIKGLKRRAEFYERTGIHCDEELEDQYVIQKFSAPYCSRIVMIFEKNVVTWL